MPDRLQPQGIPPHRSAYGGNNPSRKRKVKPSSPPVRASCRFHNPPLSLSLAKRVIIHDPKSLEPPAKEVRIRKKDTVEDNQKQMISQLPSELSRYLSSRIPRRDKSFDLFLRGSSISIFSNDSFQTNLSILLDSGKADTIVGLLRDMYQNFKCPLDVDHALKPIHNKIIFYSRLNRFLALIKKAFSKDNLPEKLQDAYYESSNRLTEYIALKQMHEERIANDNKDLAVRTRIGIVQYLNY